MKSQSLLFFKINWRTLSCNSEITKFYFLARNIPRKKPRRGENLINPTRPNSVSDRGWKLCVKFIPQSSHRRVFDPRPLIATSYFWPVSVREGPLRRLSIFSPGSKPLERENTKESKRTRKRRDERRKARKGLRLETTISLSTSKEIGLYPPKTSDSAASGSQLCSAQKSS